METYQFIEHTDRVYCTLVGQSKKNDTVMRASFAEDFLSKASIW